MPQNERSHLAFLSEQFLDLLAYKPPKDYKPARQSETALRDREYTLETLSRLSNSLADFLHQPSTPTRLTAAETSHHTILSLLSAALLLALSTARSDPVPKTLSLLTKSIKSTFSTASRLVTTPKHTQPPQPTSPLTGPALHALSQTLSSSLALKHASSFLLSFHDREIARDRSGRSGLHRDVLAEMKALGEIGAKGAQEVKAAVGKMKEGMAEGGWLDRVLDLVFGEEDGDQGEGEGVAGWLTKAELVIGEHDTNTFYKFSSSCEWHLQGKFGSLCLSNASEKCKKKWIYQCEGYRASERLWLPRGDKRSYESDDSDLDEDFAEEDSTEE